MKKYVLLAVVLLLPPSVSAWDQKVPRPLDACSAELPWGVPTLFKENTTLVCRYGYALQHDNVAKIAAWAGWTLTPDEAVGCIPRTDAFVADSSLPKGRRAEVSDYAKSGYDKGHMVPDGDLSYNQLVEWESFLMSNMSPQLPNLNRGVWKNLESYTRAWALGRGHSLTIYDGNIYQVGRSKTIGENAVVVPDMLFKIVIDDVTKEVLAFTFVQSTVQSPDIKTRLTSVLQIESMTGIKFAMPPGYDRSLVATDIWPADLGAVTAAKKAVCTIKK